MDYVKAINLFGVEARQRPSLTGAGAPSESTEGTVGELYLDTDTGVLYKCIAVNGGVYTWERETADSYTKAEIDSILGDVETALDTIINIQNTLIGGGSV